MRVKLVKDNQWHNVEVLYTAMDNGCQIKAALLENGQRVVQTDWKEEDDSGRFYTKDKTI